MLQVTDAAAQTIKGLLEANGIERGVCFRLERRPDGTYGFSLASKDAAREGERLIEWEGRKVLILPREANDNLGGMALVATAAPGGEAKLDLVKAPES